MFYLFLGCFIIVTLWMAFGPYQMTAFGEIRNDCWSVKARLMGWSHIFGFSWQNQSTTHQEFIILLLKIPIPIRIRSRNNRKDKKQFRISLKDFLNHSKKEYRQIVSWTPMIHQLLKKVKIYSFKIDWQTGFGDPATSGVIFGLIQWIRGFKIAPLDVRIHPRFYPGKSYASGQLKIKFYLMPLLFLIIKQRYFRK